MPLSGFFFGSILGVSASQWYVSRLNGTIEDGCGLVKSRPCKHIYQATTLAHEGDVINIDGLGTSRDPYPCDVDTRMHIQYIAGISIASYTTQAFVACRNKSLQLSCDFRNSSSGSIFLEGITFVNTSLNLVDCSLKMSGVMFVNSSNDAFSLNFSRGFTATISISGCTFYNISGSGIKIRGDSVNLSITDTFFTENKLRMNSFESALLSISPQSLSAQIQVNLKNINVLRNNCSGKACMEIRSGRNGITTMQMKFGSIDNNCARESVIDIRGTSVINLTKIHFRQNIGRAINIRDGNSVQLEITRSTFFENKMAKSMEGRDGGALSVKGFRREALVFMSKTLFRSNAGINGGACAFTELTLLKLDIKRCHFIQNEGSGTSAASGGALAVGTMDSHLNNATINIHDSNFTGNKIYSVDHSPSLSGGGAMALYVNYMKDLTLINTRFIENAAEHKVAGALYVMVSGTLYQDILFLNCEFIRNSGALETGTLHLVLLTSPQARVKIQNTKFIKNKASFLAQNDILVQFRGFLKIDSCTIQHNFGGGLFFQHAGDVSLENTLISDNDNFMISLKAGIKRNASFKLTNVSILRNNCRRKSNIFHVSMNQSPYSLRFQGSAFEDNFCQSGVVEISGTSDHCLETSVNSLVAMNNTLFRGNSGVAKSALSIIITLM
ncbi:unnamed protein product [Porites lobata]|uniref:Uncharacterized protein n=1 Tax=Porites lobata TaxID=104759 RepID=A0ABN8S8Q6_9CNID|nr:unnamed protein product [Porites lobata]